MKAQPQALGAVLCAALTIGVAGVDTGYGQTKPGASEIRVTVIGCVQRSQPATAETLGTTVIPAGATKYVLSNITLVPEDARTATAGAGSIGSLLAESVTMYRLDDAANSLIAPHVGDRVQVTGTVVQTSPSPRGTSGRTDVPTIEEIRAPTLSVESLRKISSDSTVCSR
jgi:hypothetical protein